MTAVIAGVITASIAVYQLFPIPNPNVEPNVEQDFSFGDLRFSEYRVWATFRNGTDGAIEAPRRLLCNYGVNNDSAGEIESAFPLDLAETAFAAILADDDLGENTAIPEQTAREIPYHVSFSDTNFDALTRGGGPVTQITSQWPQLDRGADNSFLQCRAHNPVVGTDGEEWLWGISTGANAANSILLYRCALVHWLTTPGRLENDDRECR